MLRAELPLRGLVAPLDRAGPPPLLRAAPPAAATAGRAATAAIASAGKPLSSTLPRALLLALWADLAQALHPGAPGVGRHLRYLLPF